MRGSTRSLSNAYVENITTEPHTSSTPVVEIATLPPPIATIALPEIDSASATQRARPQPDRAGDGLDQRDAPPDTRRRSARPRPRCRARGPCRRTSTRPRTRRARARTRRAARPAAGAAGGAARRARPSRMQAGDAEPDAQRDTRRELVTRDGAAEQDRAAERERAEQREREISPVAAAGCRSRARRAARGHQPRIAPTIKPEHEEPAGPARHEERHRREPQRPHRVVHRRLRGLRLRSTPATCGASPGATAARATTRPAAPARSRARSPTRRSRRTSPA